MWTLVFWMKTQQLPTIGLWKQKWCQTWLFSQWMGSLLSLCSLCIPFFFFWGGGQCPEGCGYLSSWTWDQTHIPCSGSAEVLTTGPPGKSHLLQFMDDKHHSKGCCLREYARCYKIDWFFCLPLCFHWRSVRLWDCVKDAMITLKANWSTRVVLRIWRIWFPSVLSHPNMSSAWEDSLPYNLASSLWWDRKKRRWLMFMLVVALSLSN